MSSHPKSLDALEPLFEATSVEEINTPTTPYVRTAACLIIGDEVLNGKTLDTNSNKMAKLCFELGIEMKRTEVIPDDPDTIIESVRRAANEYDWVVTSGGIGPTPDDITYDAIAKAFHSTPLVYNQETLRRMEVSSEIRYGKKDVPENVRLARSRMALFPKEAEVIFPVPAYWVPIVRVHKKVCILPGIPRLFEGLLHGYRPYIALDPAVPRPIRCLIETKIPESGLSPLLTRLTEDGKRDGIRVGSYPKWDAGVHVSLIGTDQSMLDRYAKIVQDETGGELV
ncbi:hypothetical protein MVES1_000719 [Malassezia vespertilionis]|uniref:MoaB/Mog domain-containing protein n=1 Tax=Malassezia vespertilionis TaxID=2020962 RepID=A0A2N1JGF5_9BASI|nr:uncharacterized protein MVES1_000719 [Malassezia vespertilionis]PKI85634.1 hypothetical protein MVES_000674 [Malassezia vespertilionis]WFD05389.1 hypothetical protein MVES1_000719 [Malassezia vespertilionis]